MLQRALHGGVAVLGLLLTTPVLAQETDMTQTPNTANAGINKSLEEQVGAGRGDVLTLESSLYLIHRDPFRSIARGRQLFQRKFTHEQGAGPRVGDGVGNVENTPEIAAGLGDSCATCHGRPKGSAGFGGDVFTRPDSRDAPHLFGLGLVEMLADEMTADLRAIQAAAIARSADNGRPVTRRLRTKGVRFGKITAFPDGSVDTSWIEGVDEDLRVRPFFHQGGEFSIRAFAVGAFQAEMGLQAPDPDLAAAAAGGTVTTPSGFVLDGSVDAINSPPVATDAEDGDGDGVANEIDTALVDHMEFYLLNYFRPGTHQQGYTEYYGKRLFKRIGCGSCHTPNLRIEEDRRVADVETTFDPERGHFNRLFAVAEGKFSQVDDGTGLPTLKEPLGEPFLVEGIYSDLKRHDLGPAFHERNFDGTITTEFVTEPLWGVGSTAPYGHDGRSINLHEVILRHGGEAERVTRQYERMGRWKQQALLAFLDSLVLFPPPDTASNLNEGDPNTEGFPQFGHGSIDLSALFNDTEDKE